MACAVCHAGYTGGAGAPSTVGGQEKHADLLFLDGGLGGGLDVAPLGAVSVG